MSKFLDNSLKTCADQYFLEISSDKKVLVKKSEGRRGNRQMATTQIKFTWTKNEVWKLSRT